MLPPELLADGPQVQPQGLARPWWPAPSELCSPCLCRGSPLWPPRRPAVPQNSEAAHSGRSRSRTPRAPSPAPEAAAPLQILGQRLHAAGLPRRSLPPNCRCRLLDAVLGRGPLGRHPPSSSAPSPECPARPEVAAAWPSAQLPACPAPQLPAWQLAPGFAPARKTRGRPWCTERPPPPGLRGSHPGGVAAAGAEAAWAARPPPCLGSQTPLKPACPARRPQKR
mmetsp:Transcript_50250/g.90270  ORF Transcript_50250/g.90270 Transcript_50250/m.90270 type:complete len:224 (-) Transcript_50250:743-1414(-)